MLNLVKTTAVVSTLANYLYHIKTYFIVFLLFYPLNSL